MSFHWQDQGLLPNLQAAAERLLLVLPLALLQLPPLGLSPLGQLPPLGLSPLLLQPLPLGLPLGLLPPLLLPLDLPLGLLPPLGLLLPLPLDLPWGPLQLVLQLLLEVTKHSPRWLG